MGYTVRTAQRKEKGKKKKKVHLTLPSAEVGPELRTLKITRPTDRGRKPFGQKCFF